MKDNVKTRKGAEEPLLSPPSPKACNVGFDAFFNSDKYSDCVVVCGSAEFKCHKVILANSSQVLCAMFAHDMQEKNESKLTITDLDESTVEAMLKYIYNREAVFQIRYLFGQKDPDPGFI